MDLSYDFVDKPFLSTYKSLLTEMFKPLKVLKLDFNNLGDEGL